MKYLDNVRDPRVVHELLGRIRAGATRPWTLMEVCGGQAHHLLRFGIDQGLPTGLDLRHGPGCPVCATPPEVIDQAVEIAGRPGLVFCTPSDLLLVPGNRGALGDPNRGDVRVVYSPLDALALARKNPDREVVYFAVGFETTAPAAAAAVREADRLGLENFVLLAAHRRAASVLDAPLGPPGGRVHAWLVAGHAAAVTGLGPYESFALRRRAPVVVIGSEPVDLLEGVLRAVQALEERAWGVDNQYARAVRPDGNPHARASIDAVFEPADASWRGLGRIADSGLALRPEYARFDAAERFAPARPPAPREPAGCLCGAVVTGRARPAECPSFAFACTPDRPLGSPMVSAEGACAAYHRYRRPRPEPAPAPAVAAAAVTIVPAQAAPGRS